MLKLIEWIKLLFSGSDTASTKRVVYVLVAVVGACYLGMDLHNHGMTDAWVTAFQTWLGYAGAGYVGGKAIDVVGLIKGIATTVEPTVEPTAEPKAE